MNVLELFAGSRSIGIVAEEMGMNVFSSDINAFDGIDYVVDILDFDVNRVPFRPDIIWASPPCTYFSVASIGLNWNRDNTPKSVGAVNSMLIVGRVLEIIRHFSPRYYFIENPVGKLRKLDIMLNIPRTTVMYCQYGDNRMKPTDIWSNNIYCLENPDGFIGRVCRNGRRQCHHEAAPRGSNLGTQGRGRYDAAKIPRRLCEEILLSCTNKIPLQTCVY